MKTRSFLSVTLILFFYWGECLPQVSDEKVLMTVAGRDVPVGEFIRMYNKGLDAESKTDIDTYLEQFTDFKLKVADAMALGTDTTKAFRTELEGYRNQLARTYLTDPGIKEKLILEAYQRSLTEINASHILINCPPTALPKDTLKAYMKASDIRERILNGESFEKVARESSDDKSALMNNGNLGYFTVFQMIKPFEDAAYSLKPGIISMPVRTSFGYHIISVKGRRPSKGKIKVSHIMKAVTPGSVDTVVWKVESEINKIYVQLKNGSSFKELASKYSDHKESSSRNGELNWFGAGEIISDFSEVAFSISDTGEFTKPVRTNYGFHIIKLLDKKPPASIEEARPMLESKIKTQDLNSLEKKSFISKLKKEYNFRINSGPYEWFVKNTDTLIIRAKSFYDQKKIPAGNIYSFADQNLTAKDFAKAIEKGSQGNDKNNPKKFIDAYIDFMASDQIFKYENLALGNKYPEFRYLMNEFHDGILLFDISSEKVWDRIRKDSTGLIGFYEDHKESYLSKRAIEGKIYSLNMPGGLNKLSSAFKKYSGKSDIDNRLREKFNRKGDTTLTITGQKWYYGDDPEIDRIEWTVGVHTFMKNKIPSLIFVKKIIEPVPLSFKEVQAEMINGYQDKLMNEWIKQLRDKYPVEIDKSVFNDVKKLLNNE